MIEIVVPHIDGDPAAALTHLGLPVLSCTHEDYYIVTLPENMVDDFRAAMALDPVRIYADHARPLQREVVRAEVTAEIDATWPSWKQQNAALGIYSEAERAACVAFIQSMRERVDECDALIDQAGSAEAVRAITLKV